jgi:hypothetical protein
MRLKRCTSLDSRHVGAPRPSRHPRARHVRPPIVWSRRSNRCSRMRLPASRRRSTATRGFSSTTGRMSAVRSPAALASFVALCKVDVPASFVPSVSVESLFAVRKPPVFSGRTANSEQRQRAQIWVVGQFECSGAVDSPSIRTDLHALSSSHAALRRGLSWRSWSRWARTLTLDNGELEREVLAVSVGRPRLKADLGVAKPFLAHHV